MCLQEDYDARMRRWLEEDPEAVNDEVMKQWLNSPGRARTGES